jgi:threonine dehydratase
MPATTPAVKIDAVRRYGGKWVEVIVHGESYSDAHARALEIQASEGRTFVHPFDDPLVIAGQGTIGKEILDQCSESIDAVFVAIGGGGLASGVGSWIKHHSPETKVIGVQAQGSDAMLQSLQDQERLRLDHVSLFSDGTAVKEVGATTLKLCEEVLDDIVLVSTDEICAAISDIYLDSRNVVEPAGALSLAGLKKMIAEEAWKDRSLVAVACGANMNFNRLRFVSERAEVGRHREALFAVTIPEERGSFRSLCALVGDHNVTEFNYRMSDPDEAHILVGIEIQSEADGEALAATFRSAGLATVDLSHDELAKTHLRHMVGGRSVHTKDELLYRFEFPERPGALMRFLSNIPSKWNISLFHYRGIGADYGDVLVGILPIASSCRRRDCAVVGNDEYSRSKFAIPGSRGQYLVCLSCTPMIGTTLSHYEITAELGRAVLGGWLAVAGVVASGRGSDAAFAIGLCRCPGLCQ